MLASTSAGAAPWKESVSAQVQRQVTSWQSGQSALQPVDDNGIMRYPYGSTPVVTCGVEHICSIRFQAGEKILNVATGDAARWLSSQAMTGEGDTLTPMVVVKPTSYDITTNLLVTTTRHTYSLVLQSEKDASRYDSEIGYYWPNEIVQQWSSAKAAEDDEKAKLDAETVADMPPLSAANLNFNYTIERVSDPSISPVRVFDDGAHVYIQMSETIKSTNAPALLVLGHNGETQIVNYRFKNGYYIVDRLFDKAELIAGVGSSSVKVLIDKKPKGWW